MKAHDRALLLDNFTEKVLDAIRTQSDACLHGEPDDEAFSVCMSNMLVDHSIQRLVERNKRFSKSLGKGATTDGLEGLCESANNFDEYKRCIRDRLMSVPQTPTTVQQTPLSVPQTPTTVKQTPIRMSPKQDNCGPLRVVAENGVNFCWLNASLYAYLCNPTVLKLAEESIKRKGTRSGNGQDLIVFARALQLLKSTVVEEIWNQDLYITWHNFLKNEAQVYDLPGIGSHGNPEPLMIFLQSVILNGCTETPVPIQYQRFYIRRSKCTLQGILADFEHEEGMQNRKLVSFLRSHTPVLETSVDTTINMGHFIAFAHDSKAAGRRWKRAYSIPENAKVSRGSKFDDLIEHVHSKMESVPRPRVYIVPSDVMSAFNVKIPDKSYIQKGANVYQTSIDSWMRFDALGKGGELGGTAPESVPFQETLDRRTLDQEGYSYLCLGLFIDKAHFSKC